jgi:hypothetical protein
MELTIDQKMSLAALKTNPGFLTLLAIFEEQIESLRLALLDEANQDKIIPKVREWQFYSRILEILQNESELANEELNASEAYGKLSQLQLPLKSF